MVLVKKWNFLNLFIWGKIGQENVLHDILEGKNFVPQYKNNKLKVEKVRFLKKG